MLRYNDVFWSMPFLFANDIFVPVLNDILKGKHLIKYVYGSPKCRWAGGRFSNCSTNNLKLIEKILIKILDYKVIPVFTFSNTSISMSDIEDKFCNELLKLISCLDCQIIIVSDLLYSHIKENYPNIKLTCSVINSIFSKTKYINESKHINNLLDKYDKVVIRPEYVINNNFNFSEINDLSKIELLINQNCIPNCQYAEIHYKLYDLFSKSLISYENLINSCIKICPQKKSSMYCTNSLSIEQVQKCVDNGIKNLKLQGRNFGFKGMTYQLFKYYFSNNIDKNIISDKINSILSDKLKNSLDLQLHSLLV